MGVARRRFLQRPRETYVITGIPREPSPSNLGTSTRTRGSAASAATAKDRRKNRSLRMKRMQLRRLFFGGGFQSGQFIVENGDKLRTVWVLQPSKLIGCFSASAEISSDNKGWF